VLATLGASLLLAMVLPGTWRRSGATAVLAPEAATGA